MFFRTALISLTILPSATLFVAAIHGYSCQFNGVSGVCVTLDDEAKSVECNYINGFVAKNVNEFGTGLGWPGCGTANNVYTITSTCFKTNKYVGRMLYF